MSNFYTRNVAQKDSAGLFLFLYPLSLSPSRFWELIVNPEGLCDQAWPAVAQAQLLPALDTPCSGFQTNLASNMTGKNEHTQRLPGMESQQWQAGQLDHPQKACSSPHLTKWGKWADIPLAAATWGRPHRNCHFRPWIKDPAVFFEGHDDYVEE